MKPKTFKKVITIATEIFDDSGPLPDLTCTEHWKEDKLHREDGPAVEWSDRENQWRNQWWIEGVQYSEEEFNAWVAKKDLNEQLQSDLKEKSPESTKTKI
ncbi:hypothetical protein [Ralstonia pseudosolanacearum]|uniref:hypothetical protein n=1 Tax=Ralstonia pseudosolanacearum TaxID=1310165 RepID=UPI003F78C638